MTAVANPVGRCCPRSGASASRAADLRHGLTNRSTVPCSLATALPHLKGKWTRETGSDSRQPTGKFLFTGVGDRHLWRGTLTRPVKQE